MRNLEWELSAIPEVMEAMEPLAMSEVPAILGWRTLGSGVWVGLAMLEAQESMAALAALVAPE